MVNVIAKRQVPKFSSQKTYPLSMIYAIADINQMSGVFECPELPALTLLMHTGVNLGHHKNKKPY